MEATTPLVKRAWILWLSLFLLACLAFALDRNMTSNEVVYLQKAKQFTDAHYLPADPAVAGRVPHLYLFGFVMAPLTITLPLLWVSILGRIIGYAVLGIGLARIARKLNMDVFTMAVAGAIFVWLGQSISAGEWVFGQIEAKVFAYAALFLGLDALMDRKLKRSALYFGVGTSFHVLVGGWAALALAATVLIERMGRRRDRVIAAAIWCVAASFGIFSVVTTLIEPSAGGTIDTAWLQVFFRNPHHLDPFSPSFFTPAILTAPVGFWFLAREAFASNPSPARATLARFVLVTMIPFALGLIARLAPGGASFLQYYPFRVGGTLFLLFGVACGLVSLLQLIGAGRFKWIMRVSVVGILAAVCVAWVEDLRLLHRYPMGAATNRSLNEACLWVRANVPAGAIVLAPPLSPEIEYLTNHPVVVTFKSTPPGKAETAEWYERLIQMNGGEAPTERGFKAAEEVDVKFNRLSEDQYLALGRRYGAQYLLMRRRDDLKFPRLHENRGWIVCRLP